MEAGLDMATAGWLGFAAPAGITPAVHDKLVGAFARAARDPEVIAGLLRASTVPMDLSGDAFAARVRREFDQLRELNRTLRIAVQ